MAAQANGRAKKPTKSKSNGALNGQANGHLNGHADKSQLSTTRTRSTTRKPRRTMAGALTSIIGRYVISINSHAQLLVLESNAISSRVLLWNSLLTAADW